MKTRDWILYVILPVVLTWSLDRASKMLTDNMTELSFYGPIGTVVHHNHGAIFGLFAELPAVLRVVSLSTGGAFLVFTFFILQYLMPVRSLILRSGMAILLGGILGNVTDRILFGYVVDFLVLGSFQKFTPFVFNMADVFQWTGYMMVIFALLKEQQLPWHLHAIKRSYWINPRYQLRYSLKLVGFGAGFAIIAGVYSYTFLKMSIHSLIGDQPHVEEKLLNPFLVTFLALSVCFCLLLFVVGLILSHKSAGPVYAFEKYVMNLIDGKDGHFRVRAGDEFAHLEESAAQLSDKLNQIRINRSGNA